MAKIPRESIASKISYTIHNVIFTACIAFALAKFSDAISSYFNLDNAGFVEFSSDILTLVMLGFAISAFSFFSKQLQITPLTKSAFSKLAFILFAIVILAAKSISALIIFATAFALYYLFVKLYYNKNAKQSYDYSYEISLIKARKEVHFLAGKELARDKFSTHDRTIILSAFAKSLGFFLAFALTVILVLLDKNDIATAVLTGLFFLTAIIITFQNKTDR